ncbi:hypothetical protein WJX74_005724 [Apatococcus lobatus]|uniref:Uncharacterized protein n=2 Tax=Apatococcus TaxID=904362 RepID=A0AAW1T463_9CHLO
MSSSDEAFSEASQIKFSTYTPARRESPGSSAQSDTSVPAFNTDGRASDSSFSSGSCHWGRSKSCCELHHLEAAAALRRISCRRAVYHHHHHHHHSNEEVVHFYTHAERGLKVLPPKVPLETTEPKPSLYYHPASPSSRARSLRQAVSSIDLMRVNQ